jgi:hypothetical protein
VRGIALVLLVGCGSSASFDPCAVQCGVANACPSGLLCLDDGFCHHEGERSCLPDGGVDGLTDGASPRDGNVTPTDGPALADGAQHGDASLRVTCGDVSCAGTCCNCPSPGVDSCTKGPCVVPCVPYMCDGPEDCEGSAACCASSGGASCAPSPCPVEELCHDQSDCSGAGVQLCCPNDALGYEICQDNPCTAP